jgi:cytosine/uracil/thiamine/allantoin permease
MIEMVIIAGVVGSAAGVLIAKLYLAGQAQDKATDAYEEGWTHGYDVGNKHSHDRHGMTTLDDGEEVE